MTLLSQTSDISKAFDRVWHKALLSKLPSYGLYPALCSFLSSFLAVRSIAALVDCHCSTSKPINSGVPQGSVLSPTLFLSFMNELSLTNCPIHSYADDTTLHYSTSFDRHPILQELQISRNDAAERLTSDLSIISDWGRRNLSFFQCLKTQFLHLSTLFFYIKGYSSRARIKGRKKSPLLAAPLSEIVKKRDQFRLQRCPDTPLLKAFKS